MKISEITSIIENIAPVSSALDFDNPGYNVDVGDNECTGILVCVDVTHGALERAEKLGCNLIISHHPLLFSEIRNFVNTDYRCDIVAKAYNDKITIYSAHTNMDRYSENMSVRLFKEIGVKNVGTFMDGFGAIGDIEETTLKEISDKISTALDDNRTFIVGDEKVIRRIAMVNGAGSGEDEIMHAIDENVDLFISSEFKHHILLIAKENNLNLMSVGHYSSEKCFCDIVYDSIVCHNDTIKIEKYYEGNLYN